MTAPPDLNLPVSTPISRSVWGSVWFWTGLILCVPGLLASAHIVPAVLVSAIMSATLTSLLGVLLAILLPVASLVMVRKALTHPRLTALFLLLSLLLAYIPPLVLYVLIKEDTPQPPAAPTPELASEQFTNPLDMELARVLMSTPSSTFSPKDYVMLLLGVRSNQLSPWERLEKMGANPNARSQSGKNMMWWALSGKNFSADAPAGWLVQKGVKTGQEELLFYLGKSDYNPDCLRHLSTAGSNFHALGKEDLPPPPPSAPMAKYDVLIWSGVLSATYTFPDGENLLSYLVSTSRTPLEKFIYVRNFLARGGSTTIPLIVSGQPVTIAHWLADFPSELLPTQGDRAALQKLRESARP